MTLPDAMIRFLFAVLLAGIPITAPAANDLSAAQIEGRALANELLRISPAENLEVNGLMRMRAASGNRAAVPIHLQVVAGADEWKSLYRATLTNAPCPIILTITHVSRGPNQYRLSPGGPGAEAKSVSPANTMVPFAGSDFWLADLGLEFLHWPEQCLLKKEMRRGRSCRVLESRNPHPNPGSYLRVLSWIDLETDGLIQAEAYDDRNQLFKEFYPNSVTKVNGHMELKEMEIRNVQRRSRTRIEFNFDPK